MQEADRQVLTQDEQWVLDQYRRARACRFADLQISIQDAWPVKSEITAKEQGPKKGVE